MGGMNEVYLFKFSKGVLLVSLFLLILTMMYGYDQGESHTDFKLQEVQTMEIATPDRFKIDDPVINLLGKEFHEIKQVLGKPDEEGHSELFGPHYYILFKHKEGFIHFCSSEAIENKVADSIILGLGQEVLGVKVGMFFPEIKNILGPPDFGPELGMDNLFYMDYFVGDIKNKLPEATLSFSADAINSPTKEAFLKMENFEYDQIELQGQIASYLLD
jgi:hypothetical protein